MPVSSGVFDKIHVAFLALERKFTRHTIAGTAPDVEKEFALLKQHIETAKLEDAQVPVVEPAPELKPPFWDGAFRPAETETDGA